MSLSRIFFFAALPSYVALASSLAPASEYRSQTVKHEFQQGVFTIHFSGFDDRRAGANQKGPWTTDRFANSCQKGERGSPQSVRRFRALDPGSDGRELRHTQALAIETGRLKGAFNF